MHCAYFTVCESELSAASELELFDPPPQPATASIPSATSATGSTHRRARHDRAGDLPRATARILVIMLTSLVSFSRGGRCDGLVVLRGQSHHGPKTCDRAVTGDPATLRYGSGLAEPLTPVARSGRRLR